MSGSHTFDDGVVSGIRTVKGTIGQNNADTQVPKQELKSFWTRSFGLLTWKVNCSRYERAERTNRTVRSCTPKTPTLGCCVRAGQWKRNGQTRWTGERVIPVSICVGCLHPNCQMTSCRTRFSDWHLQYQCCTTWKV